MSNLPKVLRARLGETHDVQWTEVAEVLRSTDGTQKYLVRLGDGASVEAVSIPEEDRRTMCISTQAGCPLRCTFCLTGIAGYRRNLTSGEILSQVAHVMEGDRQRQDVPWNVVVMGMGEPLLNFDNTMAALRIVMDPDGMAVSPKRVTLSTVGILPALERLMAEPVRPNLAISLHAAHPALRLSLMPIEARYPIGAVVEAADRYQSPGGGLVTYEYVLLGGVNDQETHAHELAKLLRGRRAKVNLIPLNPAPEIPFGPPTEAAVEAFCAVLAAAEIGVSVRRSRGGDILAACGQLHAKRIALAS
jgi:23S rRNA (adenine2503-C2)-methyltransferase